MIRVLIDERGHAGYLAGEFDCNDAKCPLYYTSHYHLRNIDPDLPAYGISERVFQIMVEQDLTCYDTTCKHAEGFLLHAHFPKNL